MSPPVPVREAAAALSRQFGVGDTAWYVRMCRAAVQGALKLRHADGFPVEARTVAAELSIATHVAAADLSARLVSLGLAPMADPQAPVPEAETKPEPEWKTVALAEAVRIYEGEAKAGRFPPQWRVADQVAEALRARGVHGARGPLSGATIKRHAFGDLPMGQDKAATGRDKLSQVRAEADAPAARNGVPTDIVVATWGMESSYGLITGDISTIDALATLGFEGRREDWARGQLLAALKILQDWDIDLVHMMGSWAGAMGQTQFLPSR